MRDILLTKEENPGTRKYDTFTAKEVVALTMKEELKVGSRIVIYTCKCYAN